METAEMAAGAIVRSHYGHHRICFDIHATGVLDYGRHHRYCIVFIYWF
jgi:hypothetical protein